MNKVKEFALDVADKVKYGVNKAKVGVGIAAATLGTGALTVIASAEEPASTTGISAYTTQITKQFQDTADAVAPLVVGVLGAGLAIFGIFFGIRTAKKMFSTVSK